MATKTDEFLTTMVYASEMLARPTLRNLTMSYEEWCYRSGFARQLQAWEEQRLIESKISRTDQRIYRLTEKGRLRALGGRDPEACWNRSWDGFWHLVVYDVPLRENKLRKKFRRYLQSRSLGCLQQSMWITPDPLGDLKESLKSATKNVESLIIWTAKAQGGETDEQIVLGAWDWAGINEAYANYISILKLRPTAMLGGKAETISFHEWSNEERAAWTDAVTKDPLLPNELLPKEYLGRDAWSARRKMFVKAGKQVTFFRRDTISSAEG
jgi:phenylacetic acid degradation operon negative regulatory protein